MSLLDESWRVGYKDRSGGTTITTVKERPSQFGGTLPSSVVTMRWGCGCCMDNSPLSEEERAALQAISATPELLQAVERLLHPMASDDDIDFAKAAVRKARWKPRGIPEDFPVQPIGPDDYAEDRSTCGTCARSWDDAIVTSMTPAPSGRCPFEAFHEEPCEVCGKVSEGNTCCPPPEES